MKAKIFLAAALCAIPLGAFAQSPSTSAAREIARLDREYSNLSVAKGCRPPVSNISRKTASPSRQLP